MTINIKTFTLSVGSSIGMLLATSALAAPTVMVEESFAKIGGGGQLIELSFADDASSQVTALQFEVQLPANAQVDKANCVAALPKTHTGGCSVNGNTLKVLVYGNGNEVLQATKIGSISIASKPQGGSEKIGKPSMGAKVSTDSSSAGKLNVKNAKFFAVDSSEVAGEAFISNNR